MRLLVLVDDGSPDSLGERFLERVPLPDKPVPVTAEFREELKDVLGEAQLYRGPDGNVWADIKLLPSCPEDVVHSRYPCIKGKAVRKKYVDSPPEGFLEVTLTSIGMCSGQNVDPRVRPVGEQLKGGKR